MTFYPKVDSFVIFGDSCVEPKCGSSVPHLCDVHRVFLEVLTQFYNVLFKG